MRDDEIERIITTARPMRPTEDPAVLAALDELQVAVIRRRRLRWRRHLRVGVVAAVASVTVLATAAAALVLARTGWFTEPSTEQDSSEWLNTAASDYPGLVESLAPDYVTYPDGLSEKDASVWVADATSRSGGLVQEISVVRGYESFGQCTWVNVWRAAAPEDPVRAESIERLTESAGWPAFVATDGGGQVEAVQALVASALDNDEAGVALQSQILCPPELLEGK